MSSPDSSQTAPLQISVSPGFPDWLAAEKISLAFSTYQLGKLFFVGLNQRGSLSIFERTFNRCMGLWTDTQTLWLASAFQLWRLQNVLVEGQSENGYDRLFVPRAAFTTADIDVHDVSVDANGQVVFVNTLFNCLATLSVRWNFEPLWKPPFISKLAGADRCHLNGLATQEGRLRYATACAQTDAPGEWRRQRSSGGCVIDVVSNEVLVAGLSMPHSPRWHRDRLWVLDSGRGYLGHVDPAKRHFLQVAFCPGYARGLAFVNKYAVVGTSKPRTSFAGLPLEDQFQQRKTAPQCGLQVVDLDRGEIAHWLRLNGVAEELYDVVVLPGVRRAKAFGLKTNEIRENVWFHQDGITVRWTAQTSDTYDRDVK